MEVALRGKGISRCSADWSGTIDDVGIKGASGRRLYSPFRAPSIRADHHNLFHIQIRPDPPQRAWLRVQIVNRYVEEPLDLTSMQVHRYYMMASRRLQHVRHQLRRDGRARFIFLVLPCVREVGDHGGNTSGGGGFASGEDDEELHEPVVDVARGGGLENEYWGKMSVNMDGMDQGRGRSKKPSSSRTDSPIVTDVSWLEYCSTIILVSSMPSLSSVSACLRPLCEPVVPVGDQLGKLRMAVASQELDRIGRHGWRCYCDLLHDDDFRRRNSDEAIACANAGGVPRGWSGYIRSNHNCSDGHDLWPDDIRVWGKECVDF